MPNFLECPNEYHEAHAETIWEENFFVCQTLSEECRRALPFKYFCETRYRGNPRGNPRLPYHKYELNNVIGKITFPYFDGTSKCSVISWIQKMDTYLKLDPMEERDSIKLEALHLDGDSIDWWFHGMNTLGHD